MADAAPPIDPVPADAPPAEADASPAEKVPAPEPAPPHWHRVVFILGAIVALVVAYQVLTTFVAYTDDAYVRSDLIAIAPEVTGRVVGVHVVDNQDVRAGDRLLSIDPEPFVLAVNQRKADQAEAKARILAAEDELATAKAALDQATSAHLYAQQTQRRLDDLVRTNNAPRAELDKANDALRRAEAEMIISRSLIAKAEATITVQRAALDRAGAELAIAEWRLSRTEIPAPASGSIVNLTVRIGDTATAQVALIGIVDAASWRIIANYKQDYIRAFEVGGTAWVWLDSQPWHFHRARIGGIARGFSREVGQEKLLPYVAPTTDWIRLQRRIPVTIFLVDPPPGNRLFMGADARTVIFPMMRALLAGIAADVRGGVGLVGRILTMFGQELAELGVDTTRWRQCLMAALVVPLALTLALLFELDSVWWAGISGFMTVLATGSASLKRGIIRIGATTAGVIAAVVVARWLPYDHLALALFLAVTTFLGTVGMIVSPHGMAWLLGTVTINMVLLAGLDNPMAVPIMAFNRLSEVSVGVAASALVTNLVAPGGRDRPAVPTPGWRSLLGEDWPVALQGIRAAIAVVILLVVWIWLELPSFDQMAITVVVVMAAPGAGGVGLEGRHAVAERAVHRFIGCLVGGLAALACLALSITEFLPWLLVIATVMWICMHVQTSRRGVGYVGTQAAMVFIITMAQGSGPPSSLLPGLDRFAGVTGGLLILMVVSMALWPGVDERHGQA